MASGPTACRFVDHCFSSLEFPASSVTGTPPLWQYFLFLKREFYTARKDEVYAFVLCETPGFLCTPSCSTVIMSLVISESHSTVLDSACCGPIQHLSVLPPPPFFSYSNIALQESPSPPFTCGLGLGPPSQTEPLWNAPLPTLDEEEAMGFLALDESDDTVHVP